MTTFVQPKTGEEMYTEVGIPENGGEEAWAVKNRRRVQLINKKYEMGLGPSEAAELRQLQAEVSAHINAAFPPPKEPIEALEALARRLERKDS